MMDEKERKKVREKAKLLKALGNPIRLCIVKELLVREECNVCCMQNCLELSQTTVSQHIARLRDQGIILGDRRGTEVFYRLVSKEAGAIVTLLFEIPVQTDSLSNAHP